MNETLEESAQASRPSRPETLTVEFHDLGDSMVLHRRRVGGPYPFLILFLIAWSVGCTWQISEFIAAPSVWRFLFAAPFWASWFLVVGLIFWMIFGKETLALSPTAAVFWRKALVPLTTRVIPRCEIKEFQECSEEVGEDGKHRYGIEMTTTGKPLKFAYDLPERERTWLLFQLNRFLHPTALLVQDDTHRRHPGMVAPYARSLNQPQQARSFEDPSDDAISSPPSDSAWSLVDDEDSFSFIERGRFDASQVRTWLFVNMFWNGIVSFGVLSSLGFVPLFPQEQG